jgi:signal transduction histidine kinase/DNA-binding response OmpR family regulator
MMPDDKINILIVDDLPEKLLVLESILEELGENLVKAHSGAEALRLVLEHDFAVILLDVYMPGMSGFETAGLIRQRRKSAHTPIIFITAFADEMHTAQGYSMGAVDYILSPVVPEILRTKVKVFGDLYRMTQQARKQAEERVALAKEQAARTAAEEAMRRSTFLAEASKVLSSSLDTEATRRGLLRLVVPYLADMAGVALLTESGSEWQSEFAWFSTMDHQIHFGPLSDSPRTRSALERVLAGGLTEVLDGLAVPYLGADGDVAVNSHEKMMLRSAIILPLQARGHTLGALILGQGPSGRRFSSVERALAEDLAGRAAIALDNARLYRNVQEANRQKNDFLSMLSHELRNPLTPIRNAIQLLRRQGVEDAEAPSLYEMMDRQVRHLTRMVDDLLDLSRITRGKIHLQIERVAVSDLVASAIEISRPLIDSRKHELKIDLPPQPLYVRGDPMRLAQSIGNLLHNAAKYTDEAGHISVSAKRHEDMAILRVRDNGMGIPPDMLSSIFELFKQVDRSLDRSQGGLGIGLTLVHKLVGMHGGRVEAFSDGLNQGSEFVVHLPIWLEQEPSPPASTVIPQVADTTGVSPVVRRRVLIVDDNTDAAHSLALLMEVGGHQTQLCYDGQSALTEAQKFRPEVVLLDIGLPGLDGLEVARRLRAMNLSPRPMLVALTGYGQNDDLRRSKEAGFDHHLVKPTDPAALIALVTSVPQSDSCPV